jgi:hypothetical protein
MEQMMGTTLPTGEEEDGIPKDLEIRISQMASRASDALLQRNQTEIAAQQAQQAAQDPVIQMQKQELDLKQAEEQRKAQKDQMDAQEKAERLEIEKERIASQERIAGAQLLAKTENDQAKLHADVMKDALKAQETPKSNPQKGNK